MLARLARGGPEAVEPPEASRASYEWDPTNPLKKKYCFEQAKSGRGNCIRCLRTVEQGGQRVGFDTWSNSYGQLTRWYHVECFGAFPPKGIDRFDQIIWASTDDGLDVGAVETVFNPVAEKAETGDAFKGIREKINYFKGQGCSQSEAIHFSTPAEKNASTL